MKPHPHAQLMLQYAQDALETQTPWERWEFRLKELDAEWQPFGAYHPAWHEHYDYRRKPRTININGFDVPEPMRDKPAYGTRYYVVNLRYPNRVSEWTWNDDVYDKNVLSLGLAHYTDEAAALHSKALLSFTCPQTNSGKL